MEELTPEKIAWIKEMRKIIDQARAGEFEKELKDAVIKEAV